MADLIAQGPAEHQRWRRGLREGEKIVLGRAAPPWSVEWDERISRQHVELCWQDGELRVERLPSGRNPVFHRGRETSRFAIPPGEQFVIGETKFIVAQEEATISRDMPQPLEEQTYTSQALKHVRFRNADLRLDVLSRLPEVISGAQRDEELFLRLVNMLMTGVPRADAVALVIADEHAKDDSPVNVLHWDRRFTTGEAFHPSRRLILEALRRQQSVLHTWTAAKDVKAQQFTASESLDWSFCTPIPGAECAGWAFYVAGKFQRELPRGTPGSGDPGDLREDIKFTEIVAATLSSLRQVGRLQRKQATLSHFFSHAVMGALESRGTEDALAPRLTDVSVLFCDLRGFSRKAEQGSEDLMGLLTRVSKALGVMTHHILDQGGAVGDFLGDAALGFWGWPIAREDDILRACLAALAIRQEFEAAAPRGGHALADFRVGIGLANGPAVAGGIGTTDQLKVTVFGPVVNLASRLEGMTKQIHAPILIDDATARRVRDRLSPNLGRLRRVAVVQPYGMDRHVEISELLPPLAEFSELSDQDLSFYEQGLDKFIAGDWTEALELLHRVPPRDRVKDFLTIYIAQNGRTPPADWKGVVAMTSKS